MLCGAQLRTAFFSKNTTFQTFLLSLHVVKTMKGKNLYIISGPNGAGKTTASYTVLPQILNCKEFVNADEIARGLSPFNPDGMAIEAGKLMLKRIDELLQKEESFSIETTLSTRSYFKLVETAHKKGYNVTLLYFWLESPEQAIERVAERVSKGGHDIPKDVIIRRYWAGLNNLFDIYMPIVDSWILVNNSQTPRIIVALGGKNHTTKIEDKECFTKIKEYVNQRV